MLARYKAWANERLFATLAGISETDLAAPSPIFAGSILRTLNHVYLMDVVWKSHLLGVPHGLTTRNPEVEFPGFRGHFHKGSEIAGGDEWPSSLEGAPFGGSTSSSNRTRKSTASRC